MEQKNEAQAAPESIPTHESELDQLDFRHNCMPIGVRLERRSQDAGWLALDKADWEVLRTLLTKNFDGVRAVDESFALRKLAYFAGAAVKWYEKTGTVSRPQHEAPEWTEEAGRETVTRAPPVRARRSECRLCGSLDEHHSCPISSAVSPTQSGRKSSESPPGQSVPAMTENSSADHLRADRQGAATLTKFSGWHALIAVVAVALLFIVIALVAPLGTSTLRGSSIATRTVTLGGSGQKGSLTYECASFRPLARSSEEVGTIFDSIGDVFDELGESDDFAAQLRLRDAMKRRDVAEMERVIVEHRCRVG